MSTIEIRFVSRYHFFSKDKKILIESEFLLECHIKLAMWLILCSRWTKFHSFIYLLFEFLSKEMWNVFIRDPYITIFFFSIFIADFYLFISFWTMSLESSFLHRLHFSSSTFYLFSTLRDFLHFSRDSKNVFKFIL